MTLSRVLAISLSAACVLALSACGGVPGGGGPPAPEATEWRHLTIGAPVTLDPALAYDTASSRVLENVYETLYGYGSGTTELVPRLATSYEVSPDGLVYTFSLREGVTFHSGNAFTCKDVEWSLQNGFVVAHPNGAVNYLLGLQVLGTSADGGDKGAYMAEVDFATIDQAVECPDGLDGHSVQITLQSPEPALPAILAYTSFSIVDSEYAIDNGMWDGTEATWEDWIGRDLTQEHLHDSTSGTGAYELVEVGPGFEKVTLQAFEDYWGTAPDIDTVILEVDTDESARLAAIKAGDADRVDGLSSDSLTEAEGSSGVAVLTDPAWSAATVSAAFFNFDIAAGSSYIGSGTLDGSGIPPDFFADEEIRRAFAHLYDPEGFLAASGRDGSVLTMAVPPSFEGYDPTADVRLLDPGAAEQHLKNGLAHMGWTGGFEFTAVYNAGNTFRQAVLQEIADNLSSIDPSYVMHVESLPWNDFLTQFYAGFLPMAVSGWAADYGDARNFVDPFYDVDGHFADATSIDVPEIQQVIDQAEAEHDTSARVEVYEQLGDLHYEHAPMILVPTLSPFLVVREGVTGIYYNPMLAGNFLWKDISKD